MVDRTSPGGRIVAPDQQDAKQSCPRCKAEIKHRRCSNDACGYELPQREDRQG